MPQSGATDTRLAVARIKKVTDPADRCDEHRREGGRRPFLRAAGSDEDGGEYRPAADPVDATDAADDRGDGHDGDERGHPVGCVADRRSTSWTPSGMSTTTITASKARGPGSSPTRMTDPATTRAACQGGDGA